MSSDAPAPMFDVDAVADAMKALGVAKGVRDAFLEATEDEMTLPLPALNTALKDAGVVDPEARAAIRKAARLAPAVRRRAGGRVGLCWVIEPMFVRAACRSRSRAGRCRCPCWRPCNGVWRAFACVLLVGWPLFIVVGVRLPTCAVCVCVCVCLLCVCMLCLL